MTGFDPVCEGSIPSASDVSEVRKRYQRLYCSEFLAALSEPGGAGVERNLQNV